MNKDKMQGILFIVLSAFGFACMSFFVRLSGDLPTMEKAFFRNLVAFAVAGISVYKNHVKIVIPKKSAGWLFLRCVFGTLGIICNFYAIDHMNIADSNMLNKLSPFFAVVASTFILKEKANFTEYATVVIAFVGSLFIIKPSFNMGFVVGLIGAMSGICAGTAYTCLRKTVKLGVDGKLIVMCFSGFSCLVVLPFMLSDFKIMAFWQFACLMLAGAGATLGQFAITLAYTKAPAKEISVFDFSTVIFAAILGFLFLDQIPDAWSFVGYAVILGIAVYRWNYNLKH